MFVRPSIRVSRSDPDRIGSSHSIIITSTLTFLATVNCIEYHGSQPYLVDINSKDYTIDLEIIEVDDLGFNAYKNINHYEG